MKLRDSEIFNEFAKICVEKGIIKEAEKNEPAKTFQERDKKELSNIEMLYGVKPESIYQNDLLDEAHPDPIVYSKSHDKVNGLVENLKERHNIMKHIAYKPNNGRLTQHIYAKANKELMDAIIKAAMLGAQLNDQNIMKLSELCADRLEKRATPTSAAATGLKGAGGKAGIFLLVAGLGYLIYSQNVSFKQGVVADIAACLKEITDAISQYPVLEEELRPLVEDLTLLHDLAINAANIPVPMVREKHSQKQSLKSMMKFRSSENLKKSKEAYTAYLRNLEQIGPTIPSYISSLKLKQSTLEGQNEHSNFMAGLTKAWRAISPSDISDVYNKLETVQQSINEAIPMVKSILQSYDQLDNNGRLVEEALKARQERYTKTQEQALKERARLDKEFVAQDKEKDKDKDQ